MSDLQTKNNIVFGEERRYFQARDSLHVEDIIQQETNESHLKASRAEHQHRQQ
jgi:hypothetical protein